jgi:hypothetical protein
MRMFSVVAMMAAGLSMVPARADAITLREVIDLTRAGLGEEVLLALIEIDQRVFPIDSATLRALKDAGVSEKVIVAMVKSGRTPAPLPEPAPAFVEPEPPAPQVVIVERERPAVREVVREVPVAVPVYVAVPTRRSLQSIHDPRVDPPRKPAEPVYWGWNGKLRPDAWQPNPADKPHDQKRNDRR